MMRRDLCNGIYDCSDLSDECLCERQTAENNNSYIKCSEIFHAMESVKGCSNGTIPCNGNDSDLCISLEQICDHSKDCTDGWDEKFCGGFHHSKHKHENMKTYFSCESHGFQDLTSDDILNMTLYNEDGTWKLIDWRRMFDGKSDCQDTYDEWHENFVYCGANKSSLRITRCKGPDGARLFASPSNAVDSIIFPCVEWIFGVFGVIGNSIVAVNTIAAITTRREGHRQSLQNNDGIGHHSNVTPSVGAGKNINHVLVLFLCISDLVLSIQIVLMASANEYFRGNFWHHDEIWQSSVACSVIGSMAIFSTQASALMIVVISYVRLYAVSRPFKYLRMRCVVIACASTYFIAIVLMVIPLSTYITAFNLYFTSSVHVPNSPQPDANVLERDQLESYIRKIVLLSQSSNDTDFTEYTWEELERIVDSINPQFAGWSYYGYYSFISICIPPIVSHWSDPGLIYSFLLLVVDFISFLLVFVAYYVVFRRTRRAKRSWFMAVGCCAKNRPGMRQEVEVNSNEEIPTRQRTRSMTRDEEDYEMQKRILWIIGTDCICWTPIFFLTLACIIDVDIKGTDTFLVAMFGVQINCVVNPLVYSRRVRRTIKRVAKKCVSKIRYVISKIPVRNSSSTFQVQNGSNRNVQNEIPIASINTDVEDRSTSTETLEVTFTESDTL